MQVAERSAVEVSGLAMCTTTGEVGIRAKDG